jgi:hypothetical protein
MTARWRPDVRGMFAAYTLLIAFGLLFYFVIGVLAR